MSELCDKGWMAIADRSSLAYRTGVDNFINFAYNNRIRDTPFCICPCRRCRNSKSLSFARVRHDLLVNGILGTYVIWSLHGEASSDTQRSEYVAQENIEYTVLEEETLEKEIVEESHGNDGCRLNEFVDKAFGVYEGLNEGVNVCDSEHPFIQEPNLGKKYDKYKKLAEEKIYPTCENGATTLSVIVELHHVKKRFGWSGNSVTYLLGLLRKWFPEGNTFPAKYPVMKEMLKDMGMNAENIHACVNHCVLYRKVLKDEVECPSCGASRFKYKEGKDGVPVLTNEPVLVLRHFPLPERLQKFYTVPWIAEDFTWHDRAEVSVEYMRHPIDTPQWQNMKEKWPEFAAESRNVWLGISTDGFNPRGIQSTGYSCWPVILVPYNLPPSLCMKPEFQIMSLLIPGPKQPGQDICVFLQPLIDDLNQLWEGVDAVDMHKKESFKLRAILMWGIHDLPAYGNVSGCAVHGYKACPGCGDETESNWLHHSRKIVYRNFRRFLLSNHPFRKGKHLGLKTVENNLAPARLSGEEVLMKTSNLHYLPGKLTRDGKKRKCDFYEVYEDEPDSTTKAFYKRSKLFDVSTWAYNPYRHCLDVMHCEKNFIEHLMDAILNIKKKSKDSVNAREDMRDLGIQHDQWIITDADTTKKVMPPPPYVLTPQERKHVLQILKSIKFPTGFCSNIGNNVTVEPPGLHCLKSHDYHIIMEDLLPVLIQHAFPRYPDLRRALQQISLFFRILCLKVLIKAELQQAKYMVAEAMCVLEAYFPPSFFVISIHLVVHLADEALTCGPVRYRWMYPFERAMKSFKNIPSNNRFVEGNIKESQLVAEGVVYAMEHVANSKDGNHKATREAFLDADTEYSDEGPVGYGDKFVTLTAVQFIQITRLVLFRREVEGLADYYAEYCDEQSLNTNDISSTVTEVERQTEFITWLYKKLVKERLMDSKLWRYVKGPVQAKEFNKYRVNGFTFVPKSHELNRVTQDSGVCMEATTTYRASRKDKNPVDGVTKWYGVVKQILELDYTDFKEVVFYCDWVKVESRSRGCKFSSDGSLVLVNLNNFRRSSNYYDEPAILDFDAHQVFYSTDLKDPEWSVVLHSKKRLTVQADDELMPKFGEFQSIFDDEPHLKDLLKLRKR